MKVTFKNIVSILIVILFLIMFGTFCYYLFINGSKDCVTKYQYEFTKVSLGVLLPTFFVFLAIVIGHSIKEESSSNLIKVLGVVIPLIMNGVSCWVIFTYIYENNPVFIGEYIPCEKTVVVDIYLKDENNKKMPKASVECNFDGIMYNYSTNRDGLFSLVLKNVQHKLYKKPIVINVNDKHIANPILEEAINNSPLNYTIK